MSPNDSTSRDSLPQSRGIHVAGLGFTYARGKRVLAGVNIDLREPGFCAITGRSGCGKSTLLQLLLGAPDTLAAGTSEGKIEIAGGQPSQAAAAGKVAWMSQRDSLFPSLTVQENLLLPLRIRGSATPANFTDLVQRAGLDSYLDLLPRQLSGGTMKRVELLRAFIMSPEVVLLDEPFSIQDLLLRHALYQLLLDFQKISNCLVVFVTHDPLEAVLLSNRVLLLDMTGKIQEEMRIAKPLPRILDAQGPRIVEEEHIRLRTLILREDTAA